MTTIPLVNNFSTSLSSRHLKLPTLRILDAQQTSSLATVHRGLKKLNLKTIHVAPHSLHSLHISNGFYSAVYASHSFAHVYTSGAKGGALASEMNSFIRIRRIVESLVGSIISGGEDPERLLQQAAEEMSNDLAKLRQTAAQVVAAKRMTESKFMAADVNSKEWHRRARLALEKGDEGLAREALRRKKEFDVSAAALKAQLDQQKAVCDQILTSSRALEGKIMSAKSRKDNLIARAQAAKTSKNIQEMLGSIDTSSALAAYERMEEKVIRLEAEAGALSEISSDQLGTKFAMLEMEDVGDDLEQLKREVNAGKVRAELPIFESRGRVFEKERERASIRIDYY